MIKAFILSFLIFLINSHGIARNSQETRELPYFDKLRITNEIRVFLTQGDSETAKVVVSGIDIEDVITEVDGKTLEITLRRGVYKDISVEVYLTYRDLRSLFVSGSGRASFQSVLKGDKVILNASTNSQIDVEVSLKTLDILAGKGGSVRLSGILGSYEANINTGGILTANELTADSAFVTVRAGGLAKVAARELIEANVRSGSTLSITGSPKKKNIRTGIGAKVIEQ